MELVEDGGLKVTDLRDPSDSDDPVHQLTRQPTTWSGRPAPPPLGSYHSASPRVSSSHLVFPSGLQLIDNTNLIALLDMLDDESVADLLLARLCSAAARACLCLSFDPRHLAG